jgi:hypothetical protein
MESNFKAVFEFKAGKIEVNKQKILSVINTELSNFNFEDDYRKEGRLEIISCNKIIFHTCTLENFTDSRSISESNRPNKYGISLGHKLISEFNTWDYELSYEKEFQNSDDHFDIQESHHAKGCGTCKQHGKIRCSDCIGAGEITCGSCSGRGEKQCSSCSGRGESKCWSCSGKGSMEVGYGDNKRIERCSSCSGRGYKPCSSCSNGYVTCTSCSGRGRITCYTCHGSGEVICYQCDGYRTMDHYYIVHAKFNNLHQSLFVTNPFSGFDIVKAGEASFSIQNKLFHFKETKFEEGYFEHLKSHPLYRQICAFLGFKDSESTKLICSRITFFENTYFEVVFSFYGENYTIYLDQNLAKSYYGGKKPSDLYELDLLKKMLNSAISNKLDLAKKTILKLSDYKYISINEKFIATAIEDTQKIYEVKKNIDSRDYSHAERTLRHVSDVKKSEKDYELLIKRLNRIYFNNTSIVGLLCFVSIFYKLIDKNIQFAFWNILVSVGIISVSWLVNLAARSINWSRRLVLVLFIIQFSGIFYLEYKDGDKINERKWTGNTTTKAETIQTQGDGFHQQTKHGINAPQEYNINDFLALGSELIERHKDSLDMFIKWAATADPDILDSYNFFDRHWNFAEVIDYNDSSIDSGLLRLKKIKGIYSKHGKKTDFFEEHYMVNDFSLYEQKEHEFSTIARNEILSEYLKLPNNVYEQIIGSISCSGDYEKSFPLLFMHFRWMVYGLSEYLDGGYRNPDADISKTTKTKHIVPLKK